MFNSNMKFNLFQTIETKSFSIQTWVEYLHYRPARINNVVGCNSLKIQNFLVLFINWPCLFNQTIDTLILSNFQTYIFGGCLTINGKAGKPKNVSEKYFLPTQCYNNISFIRKRCCFSSFQWFWKLSL